jgi:hypothetical protein
MEAPGLPDPPGPQGPDPSPPAGGDPGPSAPAPGPWTPPPAAAAAWSWPSLDALRPAGGLLLAGAAVTGVLFDLAIRSGALALGAALVVWAAVATLLVDRRTSGRWPLACFAAAAALAAGFVLRASPWLLVPDLAAVVVLVSLGVLIGPDGDPRDLRTFALGVRVLRLAPRLVWIPTYLARPAVDLARRLSGRRRSDAAALARGLLIAVPVAVVLGALLASADPVFASFFDTSTLHADPGDVLLHGLLVASGGLLLVAIAGCLSVAHPAAPAPPGWLGAREALVLFAVIDVLFALFAVAQVVAVTGHDAGALRRAGVTPSDYARSGFFQLLWVAGLSWVVVAVGRRAVPAGRGPLRTALVVSVEVAVGLVLLIVYVAHSRLQLYEASFGFTMLRLYSHVFAGVVAAAFVLLGLAVAGLGSRRNWLPGAVGGLVLAVLVGLNAVNPEAVVLRLNEDQAAHAAHGKLDVDYLASLSDDAVPLALQPASGPSREQRDRLAAGVCAAAPAADGWEAASLAARAAADARRSRCRR